MTEKIEFLPRATPQVSRRIVVQIAPVFPLVIATGGITLDAADAEDGYDQSRVKMSQVLRSNLQGQGSRVQESIITHVEFPPGQGAPTHFHPAAQEILYVLEGSVTVEQEGLGVKAIGTGEVALTPADVPHLVRNDGTNVAAKALVFHSRADKEKPLLVVVRK